MTLYPNAQKKAQAELDAVVGTGRLPEFSDRTSLPYVGALVKELLRWHCGTPLGLAHRAVADDEYDGHLIPGGATVLVNMWCVDSWFCAASLMSYNVLTCHLIGHSCATPRCTRSRTTSCRSASWTRRGTWTSRDAIRRTSFLGLAVGKVFLLRLVVHIPTAASPLRPSI